ncbi:MAG: HEPN domain-containing protein [Candidatus Diapherotrites archaeon]|uniref:HEPN domain-containing protein n=1 Tax=Candidatus Iainarchaeum sp. TaxID=3101447 RepID=A0A8T4L493_9ARCH|nr:HEPN domain-containing protein [Candidatus Diapherotrites archaeon]
MRREIEIWMEQAQIDLQAAESNYKTKYYYVCAFLCQQAVEKAMKAVFMFQKNQSPPNLHNLRELGELIGVPENLLSKARKLSRDFIISRYPDAAGDLPAKTYDEKITKEILMDAKELITWLEKKLE